jgi:16S rRNA processing protein RimM
MNRKKKVNKLSDIDFIEIGKVLDIHGFEGELIIHFSKPVESLKEKELFFVLIDGIHVPFFIEHTYKKSNARLAVKFKDLNKNSAKELINGVVFTESTNISEPEAEENEYLIGFELYDNNEYAGKITDVLKMSANELVEIFHEAKQKEVLIPYHKDLIEKIDDENRKIYFRLPEGIFDIND